MNAYLMKIKESAIGIVEPKGKIVVDVTLRKEFGTQIISVVIDDPTTFTLDIDEVATINQELLDIVNDDIPDGYYLEVTSLGVERELHSESDYQKAIGKYVCIKTYQKIETAYQLKEIYGDLQAVTPTDFVVESLIQQKKKIVTIPKDKVSKIRLAVKF